MQVQNAVEFFRMPVAVFVLARSVRLHGPPMLKAIPTANIHLDSRPGVILHGADAAVHHNTAEAESEPPEMLFPGCDLDV